MKGIGWKEMTFSAINLFNAPPSPEMLALDREIGSSRRRTGRPFRRKHRYSSSCHAASKITTLTIAR